MIIGWISDIKIPIATIKSVIDNMDMDADGCISVKELIVAIRLAIKRIKNSE